MYSLTCLLGLPVCIAGSWWADDIVSILLGDQWFSAIPVLRALFIAAAARMLLAPTGWVYVATGRPGRMLTWQVIWTPFILVAFIAGLQGGALGVAIAYAIALWVSLMPGFLYCFQESALSLSDVLHEIHRPLVASLVGTGLAVLVQYAIWPGASPGAERLAVRMAIATTAYGLISAATVPLAHEIAQAAVARLRLFAVGQRPVTQQSSSS
jgi:PST family polysaccharide transporter